MEHEDGKKIVIFRRPVRVAQEMAIQFNNEPYYAAKAAKDTMNCVILVEDNRVDLLIIDENLEKKYGDEGGDDKNETGENLIKILKNRYPKLKAILIAKKKVSTKADYLILEKFEMPQLLKLVRVMFKL
jgi:putative cell wall-binding protein